MLLGTSQSLEELLVLLLTQHRFATVGFLHRQLAKHHRRYSLPAVYKELRKLETHGVVFRRGSEVSLSLAWVVNFSSLAERMHELHVESPELDHILPTDGKKRTFRFSSLARVDDFWVHAIILMAQNSKRKKLYQWFPHPWFNLIHSQKSYPFQQALKAGRHSVVNIVGGRTWLDQRAAKVSLKNVYEYNFSPSEFQSERTRYYSVTDTFLLTIKLREGKAAEIDQLYQSVASAADLDISRIIRVVCDAPGTLVTIERGGSQLKKVWNKFIDHFEVSRSERL